MIARMRDASTGNSWTCDFEAGVPEENKDGRVDDATAQSEAAAAANRSAWVVFNEMKPPFIGAAVCVRFVEVMNVLLRREIAGAKVTRCITRGLPPTYFGN